MFSGDLRFFVLNAYRQKGVLNKKGRRFGCDEVGSDQSKPAGKREPEPFSPETRIANQGLAVRSAKKSPNLSWNGEIQDGGAARRGSFLLVVPWKLCPGQEEAPLPYFPAAKITKATKSPPRWSPFYDLWGRSTARHNFQGTTFIVKKF